MTPNAALERLVDQVADAVLFGDSMIELPVQAMRSVAIDVMAMTAICDPLIVERRVLNEFQSRLDWRLRAAVDDVTGARWRALLGGLEECFPNLH
jgi:hypothetical protein